MCRNNRSNYGRGHGHGHCGYGHQPHRGGPLTALVALAVPLLTQRYNNTGEKQALAQDHYEPYQPCQPQTDTREYLAPQITGRTAATSTTPLPPTGAPPRGPPPAYEADDKSPRPHAGTAATATDDFELERDLSGMSITDRPAADAAAATAGNPTYPSPGPVVGARDYRPVSAPQPTMATATPTARELITAALLPLHEPSSRWAARLHRKEDKARAKLLRKAERYARRERRDWERAGCY